VGKFLLGGDRKEGVVDWGVQGSVSDLELCCVRQRVVWCRLAGVCAAVVRGKVEERGEHEREGRREEEGDPGRCVWVEIRGSRKMKLV